MEKCLIQIRNLKKYYKNGGQATKALDDISLDIYKGEIIGLLGVNGAGKTTLSSIISTLHPPTSGDILFDGKSIYKDINTFRRIIGFCPQKPNLIKDLTVQQNLEMAGRYFGMTKCQACERMEELVAKYDLEKYRNSKMDELSGGYNHRVLIARSMVHKPKLLILDEPTVGLDPHIRQQLWVTIQDLKKAGVTVVLTTHYLDEAEVLSDRICILDSGKIKLIDTPENMMKVYKKSNLEDVFLQLMNEETALK